MVSRDGIIARAFQGGVLCVAMVLMMGAGESRLDRLGHQMMCICGCSEILLECNHVGCPDSARMIGELKDQLAAGGSDKAILGWFAAKYGGVVLASPIRGGFDDVAWIMPIAVFSLATIGTGIVVWLWRRRAWRMAEAARGFGCGGVLDREPLPVAAGGPDPEATALRERIRRETEY
jgi:cytochrome c-type biogenesis protein CcmH